MARKKSKSKKTNGAVPTPTVATPPPTNSDDNSASDDVLDKTTASTPSSSLPVSPSSAASDTAANDLSPSSFPDVDVPKPVEDVNGAVVADTAAPPSDAPPASNANASGCCSSKKETAQNGSSSDACCSGGSEAQEDEPTAVHETIELPASSAKAPSSGCCSSKKAMSEQAAAAVVAPVLTDAAPATSCCSSKRSNGNDSTPAPAPASSGCCSSKAKAVETDASAPVVAAPQGCASRAAAAKPANGSSCCSSKAPSSATEAAKPTTGSSCCSSKAPAAASATGCSTEAAKSASGSSCCSSKKPAAPSAASSSCCAPSTAAPPASGCSSTSEAKSANGSSCCSSKATPPTPAATTGCCSSKTPAAPSSSSSCCASTSKPLERKPSNSHPDRVRERLFDRMTEFKTERGASMAPQSHAARAKAAAHRPEDVATLRLAIGGMTCSGCCTRIEKFMERRPGIVDVNVSLLTSRGVFAYDAKVTSAKALEDMVGSLGFSAGVLPDESLVSLVLHIGYESPSRVCPMLLAMDGVVTAVETKDAAVSPVASSSLPKTVGTQRAVVVDYDPDVTGARTIVRQLSRTLGFHVYASSPRPLAVQNEEADVAKFRAYLLWSCVLALPIVVLEYILPLFFVSGSRANPVDSDVVSGLSYKDAIGFVCATPILLFVAYPIHESAFLALRYGGRVTMDVLISLSSFTAYTFSVVTVVLAMTTTVPERSETFFEVTALLVTLILVGRYIEKIVKAKASNSVDALLRIQAKTAILLERSSTSALKESYIDVILVERDDLLRVLPGTRIPTDGVVVEGTSAVDESMVTGESRKVPKAPGSTVIGGTINAQGVLVMRVTHTITESMLARIVTLVDEAQASKCVSQTLADVVASYFTTFIIAISVIMFGVWYHLAATGRVETHGWAPLPFALRFAITVLVISCPCAISLAVPTAIMVATTIGSQFGVLFKGGQAIEALEGVDVVMFDKTGTLTAGQLTVVDSEVALDASSSDALDVRALWSLVGAAEAHSEHAIGRALVAHARSLHAPERPSSAFAAVPGCGVTAVVGQTHVRIGSLKWMQDVLRVAVPVDLHAANSRFQQRGFVVVCVALESDVVAVVALRDAPRPEAQFVIEQLRRQKIQTWIVTGDQRETALSIAAMLGVPEFTVIADALPHQKVDKVRLLQSIGKTVAFVGDGVNDGPALAMANVGIAVGAGTDVALESADLVLVKDDLRDLLNAIDLSRATNRMIKWNFSWGFAYNVLMMPLACGALYPLAGITIAPALAGLSELLSSVPVILFSLLLNWWRPPHTRSSSDATDDAPHVVLQVDTTARETTPLLLAKK